MVKHKYGLKKDISDDRDFSFGDLIKEKQLSIPSEIDLRDKMPPIWEQKYSDCQSNAMDRIVSYLHNNNFNPSRLYTYYNIRSESNDTDKDSGATLRDSCKGVADFGVCKEEVWPYSLDIYTKPVDKSYTDGETRKISNYYRINNLTELKQAMSLGHIPIIGISIYQSFESDECMKTGIVPRPYGNLLGGHAVDVTAYHDNKTVCFLNDKFRSLTGIDSKGYVIIDNSWGTGIGLNGTGRFKISYEILERLLMDMWIVVK